MQATIPVGAPVATLAEALTLQAQFENELQGHYRIQGETGQGFRVVWSRQEFAPAPRSEPIYCAWCLERIGSYHSCSVCSGNCFCSPEHGDRFMEQVKTKQQAFQRATK